MQYKNLPVEKLDIRLALRAAALFVSLNHLIQEIHVIKILHSSLRLLILLLFLLFGFLLLINCLSGRLLLFLGLGLSTLLFLLHLPSLGCIFLEPRLQRLILLLLTRRLLWRLLLDFFHISLRYLFGLFNWGLLLYLNSLGS